MRVNITINVYGKFINIWYAVHISPKQEFLQPCIFPHFLKWSNKNSGFLLWCLLLKAGGGGVVLNIDWSPLKKNVGIFLAIDYKYV